MISSCFLDVMIQYPLSNEFLSISNRNMNTDLFLLSDQSQFPSSLIILRKDYSRDVTFALCYKSGEGIRARINAFFYYYKRDKIFPSGGKWFCLHLPSWLHLPNWLRSQSSCLSSIFVVCSIQPLNACSDCLYHAFGACHSNYCYHGIKVHRVEVPCVRHSHRRLPLLHFSVFKKKNFPKRRE